MSKEQKRDCYQSSFKAMFAAAVAHNANRAAPCWWWAGLNHYCVGASEIRTLIGPCERSPRGGFTARCCSWDAFNNLRGWNISSLSISVYLDLPSPNSHAWFIKRNTTLADEEQMKSSKRKRRLYIFIVIFWGNGLVIFQAQAIETAAAGLAERVCVWERERERERLFKNANW